MRPRVSNPNANFFFFFYFTVFEFLSNRRFQIKIFFVFPPTYQCELSVPKEAAIGSPNTLFPSFRAEAMKLAAPLHITWTM